MGFSTDTKELHIGSSVGNLRVMGDYVTPEMYGAEGDGISDDTAPINAMFASMAAGGKCVFPAPSYRVTGSVIVPFDGLDIYGSSNGGTSLVGYGAINIMQLGDGLAGGGFTYAGVYGGSIHNLTFQDGDGTCLRGLYILGARSNSFYDVRTRAFALGNGFSIAGIEVRESWVQRWYHGYTFNGEAKGIYLNPVDGVNNDISFYGTGTVRNTGIGLDDLGGSKRHYDIWAEGNAGGGLQVSGVEGFAVQGGYYEANGQPDILVTGNSRGGTFGGSYFAHGTNNDHSNITLAACSDITILSAYSVFDAVNGARIVDVQTGASGVVIMPLRLTLTGGAAGNVAIGAGLTTDQTALNVQAGTGKIQGTVQLGDIVTASPGRLTPHQIGGLGIDDGAGGVLANYGGVVLHANDIYTGNARRFMITNALTVNKFAIIRSVNANTDPALGVAGALSSGVADLVIDVAGRVGIAKVSPNTQLAVGGLPSYANDAAAGVGGLTTGDFYLETGTNPLRVACKI
jgi:hypothetical protein